MTSGIKSEISWEEEWFQGIHFYRKIFNCNQQFGSVTVWGSLSKLPALNQLVVKKENHGSGCCFMPWWLLDWDWKKSKKNLPLLDLLTLPQLKSSLTDCSNEIQLVYGLGHYHPATNSNFLALCIARLPVSCCWRFIVSLCCILYSRLRQTDTLYLDIQKNGLIQGIH